METAFSAEGESPDRSEPARAALARTGPAAIFVRYVAFAVIATAVNLLAQAATYRLSPIAALPLSILAGTAAGFLAKYVLDKRWIFGDPYGSHRDEMQKVALYGAFSIATTLVFWSFEVLFWTIWRTEIAKYTGAIIGLAIGYAAKYGLDRTFVFRERQA
jgi:putative flippase GtrA